MTTSVAVAEAIARQDFDSEDIVTDLINRAEAGLEEARKRGGNEIVSLEMAKIEFSRRGKRQIRMAYENLLYEKRDQIGFITFNRPKVLNALNRKTMEELNHVLTAAREDEEVRVLILTGAGEKSFVAGADIGELAVQTPVSGKETASFGQSVLHRLETLGKPSIAAINGFALGGGCELALACTIRLASKTAKLGQPEVKLGIITGYGGSQRLVSLVRQGSRARTVPDGRNDFGRGGAAHRSGQSRLRAGGVIARGGGPGKKNYRECAARGEIHDGSYRARRPKCRWKKASISKRRCSDCAPPRRTCGKARAHFWKSVRRNFAGSSASDLSEREFDIIHYDQTS